MQQQPRLPFHTVHLLQEFFRCFLLARLAFEKEFVHPISGAKHPIDGAHGQNARRVGEQRGSGDQAEKLKRTLGIYIHACLSECPSSRRERELVSKRFPESISSSLSPTPARDMHSCAFPFQSIRG